MGCTRGPAADGSTSVALIGALKGNPRFSINVSEGTGLQDKVLRARVEDDFHDLVGVLANAMRTEKQSDLREFQKPYNPNRHDTRDTSLPLDKRKRQVLR